jgi:hypothetical protein
MTLTLTQYLRTREQRRLFGQLMSGLASRGDLGLGLDPAGPVQFACIHAVCFGEGPRRVLAPPVLLAVFGPGEEEGTDQTNFPGERCWCVRPDDRSLRLDFHLGSIEALLPNKG